MKRITSDELERRVDEVLFYIWDPIGVNSYVSARAEYRSYIPQVLIELEVGDIHKLNDLLLKIEIGMGLEPKESKVQEVVELLFNHKEAIVKEHA